MLETEPIALDFLTDRKKSFEELYEQVFPSVAKFVSQHGGTFQDAKDIFHDALIIFYEKSLENDLYIEVASEKAYIVGIAKHLWFKKFKEVNKKTELTDKEIVIPADGDDPSPAEMRILNLLERAGKKCLDLLTAFYYEKSSLKEITKSFGYRNVHSATVQKFKCLEKVKFTIKEKSLRYEDFME